MHCLWPWEVRVMCYTETIAKVFFKMISFSSVAMISPFLFVVGCVGILFTKIMNIMNLLN